MDPQTVRELDNGLTDLNIAVRQTDQTFLDVLGPMAAQIKEKLAKLEDDLKNALVVLPNIPSPSVPSGKTPEDNEVVFLNEKNMPKLDDDALPHWELTAKYDIIDFELGNKIAGAGFFWDTR